MHRTDLTDTLPLAIQMVETVVNYGDAELGVVGMRTGSQETIWNSSSTTTAATVANSQYVSTPSDLLDIRRLFCLMYGQKVELKQAPIAPMELDEQAQLVALPQRYSVVGSRLYLDPIPNAVYPLEAFYYKGVPALSTTNTTNWLLTKMPTVYLWGTLYYLTRFVAGAKPEIASTWLRQFKGAMRGLQKSDIATRFGNTVLRTDIPPMIGRNFSIITGI